MASHWRAHIASIALEHIEVILDRLMQAYAAEIPRVSEGTPDDRRAVREAARRTIESFLEVYGGDATDERLHVRDARRVTTARAGERFERSEIEVMLRIARHVVFQMARDLVRRQMPVSPEQEADVDRALDQFLEQLQRGDRAGDIESVLDELLSTAEREGPDLG